MPIVFRGSRSLGMAAGAGIVVVLCLTGAAGAPLPLVESEGSNPACLSYWGSPPRITIPAEAAVNKPVTVVIETSGGGCTRKGTTTVAYSRKRVDLRPHDIFPAPGTICILLLRLHRHEVTLKFARPGRVTVNVHGTCVGELRREAMVVSRSLRVR